MSEIVVFNWLNSLSGRSGLLDGLIVFSGEYLAYVLLLAFVCLIIWYYKKTGQMTRAIWVLGGSLASALIARYVIVELIRHFYHSDRPFVTLDTVSVLIEHAPSASFPSGHVAFFATLGAILYLYNKSWGTGFLLATFAMGLARVAAGIHWPADALAGLVVGALTTCLLVLLARPFTGNTKPRSI